MAMLVHVLSECRMDAIMHTATRLMASNKKRKAKLANRAATNSGTVWFRARAEADAETVRHRWLNLDVQRELQGSNGALMVLFCFALNECEANFHITDVAWKQVGSGASIVIKCSHTAK
jgi:superfamily II RNA helicase